MRESFRRAAGCGGAAAHIMAAPVSKHAAVGERPLASYPPKLDPKSFSAYFPVALTTLFENADSRIMPTLTVRIYRAGVQDAFNIGYD